MSHIVDQHYLYTCIQFCLDPSYVYQSRRGLDHIVVDFTTTYASMAYHQ